MPVARQDDLGLCVLWLLSLSLQSVPRCKKVALYVFELLSKIVTCTKELISIYMCYSQGDGLNTSLCRILYLVLHTVVQLSTCLCPLSSYGTEYPMYWTLMCMIYKLRLPLHL